MAFYSVARADNVTLQATQYNSIYSESASSANGAGDFLFAGVTRQADIRRALLQFDPVAELPAHVRIQSATLRLQVSRTAPSASSEPHTVHLLAESWGSGASDPSGEEGVGTGATPTDATWNHRFFGPATTWSVIGGTAGSPIVTAIVDTTGPVDFAGAGLRDAVQAWVDSPATNFGLQVRGNEADTFNATRFFSPKDDLFFPTLTVEFTVVPEPASPGLLLTGILVCVIARKGIGARSSRPAGIS